MKTIYIKGLIGLDTTAEMLQEQVAKLSKEKLQVIIQSPGGFVDEGFDMYNILNAYKGPLEIVLGVMAASIASYVAMAVPVENRKAFKNSVFMFHEVRGGFLNGRARDLRTMATYMDGLNDIAATTYANGLGWDFTDTREKMQEDYYLVGGNVLLENGIVSGIIDAETIDVTPGDVEEQKMQDELTQSLQNMKLVAIQAQVKTAAEKVAKSDQVNGSLTRAIHKDFNAQKLNTVQKNIQTEDTKMGIDLKTLLSQNSDAQAEFDKHLQTATATERKRFDENHQMMAKVLEFEGVTLSMNATQALNGEITMNEYKDLELVRMRALQNTVTPSNVFGSLAVKQTPAEQDGGASAAKIMTLAEIDEKAKSLYKKTSGEGGTF